MPLLLDELVELLVLNAGCRRLLGLLDPSRLLLRLLNLNGLLLNGLLRGVRADVIFVARGMESGRFLDLRLRLLLVEVEIAVVGMLLVVLGLGNLLRRLLCGFGGGSLFGASCDEARLGACDDGEV